MANKTIGGCIRTPCPDVFFAGITTESRTYFGWGRASIHLATTWNIRSARYQHCLLIGNRHQVLQVCFGWPLGRFYGVIARSCSSFIWFLVNINLALFKLSHENTCNHVLFSTRCSFDFTHPHQGSLIKMWSMACLISFFVSTLYALFWLFSPIYGICPWCAFVFSPLPVRARDSQRYIFRLWVWKATTSSSMGCAWDGWDGSCPHDCVEVGILKPEMVVALDRVDSLLESSQWWRIEV